MPVTIGELTTEVIAEPDTRGSDSDHAPDDKQKDAVAVQSSLVAIARRALRTSAEDFDD